VRWEGGVSVRVGGGGGRYTVVAAATGRERGSMSFGGARAVRDTSEPLPWLQLRYHTQALKWLGYLRNVPSEDLRFQRCLTR